MSFFWRSLARARLSASGGQRKREVVGRRREKKGLRSPKGIGERTAVPVSSRFWVRSAGQELLVTPTREAVTWGSPLYTFKWLLDRGSCGGRRGGGLGESSPGPMVPGAAVPEVLKLPLSPFSTIRCAKERVAQSSPALRSPWPGRRLERNLTNAGIKPQGGAQFVWEFEFF